MLMTIIKSLYIATIETSMGYLAGWKLFDNLPPVLIFAWVFFASQAMYALAFLVSSCVSDAKTGYSVAYGLLLISFVFQVFFTDPNAISFLFVDNDQYVAIKWLRRIFSFYPGFNFVHLWSCFVGIAGVHFDNDKFNNAQGRQFEWKDLDLVRSSTLPDGTSFHIESASTGYKWLIFNYLWMLILAWVVDNFKLPNSKVTLKSLFCITKGNRKSNFSRNRIAGMSSPSPRRRRSSSLDSQTQFFVGEGVDLSVEDEKKSTKRSMREWRDYKGLLCSNISKVYKKYPCLINSKQDVHALDSVYLNVKSGDLLTILGQNGAGKTTLINVLSGRLTPSSGDVKVFGLDLKEDNEAVKQVISLCPQFDIYWTDLTVREHIELFGVIKGEDPAKIRDLSEKLIKEINLWDRRDYKTTQLSGGMKRRVSIAISTIGDPRIIFLDEPTTGLDPVTQRKVMKLIEVRKFNQFHFFFKKLTNFNKFNFFLIFYFFSHF